MKLSVATVITIVTIVASIALTFGMQMEKLNTLQKDVEVLKGTVNDIMVAVGTIEHKRWRENKSKMESTK